MLCENCTLAAKLELMHHLVRNNSPYTAILLFIFTLVVHLQVLSHPVLPDVTGAQLLFGWCMHLLSFVFGKAAFAYSLLAVVMVYLQAMYVNRIAAQYKLFQQNNYIVAFTFIVLSSLHPVLGQMNAQLVLNFLVLFAFSELMYLKQTNKPNKHLFNIGFALMLAALVQFSAIFLLVFMFIGLLVLRAFSPKEWLVAGIGMVMPLYFVSVILFCVDKLGMLRQWADLGVSLPRTIGSPTYFFGLLAGLIIWVVLGMYNMQTQMGKAIIYIRRCWLVLIMLLIFTIFAAIFTDSAVKGVWMMVLPALSLVLSFGFINERSKKMNAISFYFALLLLVFCQLYLPF